jgi:homoserine kinase
MKDSIRVFAPATVANVGCAFDVLGFALNEPGDEVILKVNGRKEVRVVSIEGDGGVLSKDPLQNTASVALKAMLTHMDSYEGFDIYLRKKMPLGSGLGSSAASAVAAIFAANELLGNPLKQQELLPFAMEGERLACGSAHADNVGPSLLGGFVLIPSYHPLIIRMLPVPKGLMAVVVHPEIEVKTRDARDVLRQKISLKAAASQWGRVGGMISSLFMSDFDLMASCLDDQIVEPSRAVLIPGFYRVKQAALEHGALGCSISGSGPSVFALCGPGSEPGLVAEAMQKAFNEIKIHATPYVSEINKKGPVVLEAGS